MPSTSRAPPFGRLRYLYVGSSDVARDLAHYEKAGASVVWDKTGFGTRVAAVRISPGPLLLLAGHRPAGSVLFCYEVDDLEAVTSALTKAGWTPHGERFEIPNGPGRLWKDPSGIELALFENIRPNAFGGDED